MGIGAALSSSVVVAALGIAAAAPARWTEPGRVRFAYSLFLFFGALSSLSLSSATRASWAGNGTLAALLIVIATISVWRSIGPPGRAASCVLAVGLEVCLFKWVATRPGTADEGRRGG